MLAGAGDELQGIKRGLMELADILVVHKADGDNLLPARRAAATYRSALHLLRPTESAWAPRVQCASSTEGTGVDEVWSAVLAYRETLREAGRWEARRREQAVRWMWAMVDEGLRSALRVDPSVRAVLDETLSAVLEGQLAPTRAADSLLASFRGGSADPA